MRYRWVAAIRPAAVRAAVAALAAATAVVPGACSGPGPSSAAVTTVPDNGCRAPSQERLDPRSTNHLFTGAPEPTYLSDPPTSGPHRLGPPYRGALTTPISRPSQVAMLEAGFVLLQYRGLAPDQVAVLDGLAGDLVTVAPPAGLLPSPVVATAWTWKLECGSAAPAAVSAIRTFIAAHQGAGFGGNIPVTTLST